MNKIRTYLIEKKIFEISNRLENVIVWTLLFISLAASLFVIMINDKNLYYLLVKESAYTELLTAILYAVSGMFFFAKGYRKFKNDRSVIEIVFFILFGILFVFIAGEEESWGQWIFRYNIPESVSSINVQSEMNIHNLKFIAKYSNIFSTHRLLSAFSGMLFFIIPLMCVCLSPVRRFFDKIYFPVAPLICAPLFIIVIIYEKTAMAVFNHWSHAEMAEFLYSIGFFLYAVSVYTDSNRSEYQ